MKITPSSAALVLLVSASSAFASPQFSRDDALAQRDGILSTVGDAFHNVTGAIADGITNYTTAVGNATRNAIDDDNSGASFPVSQSMYAALAGSIVVGALLI